MPDYVVFIVMAVAMAALFWSLHLYLLSRYRRKHAIAVEEDNRAVRAYLDDVVKKYRESQAILDSLNFGVVVYGSGNLLLSQNKRATDMLKSIPNRLEKFFELYGNQNGIKERYLLGYGEIEGKLTLDDRVLRIVCQRRDKPQNRHSDGHIIVIQDITSDHKLEENRKTFVANVSHELKTPLTTIKSYSETLLQWGISEKDELGIAKDVKKIFDNAERMENLIQDLLLLSSIDSDAHYMKAKVCDAKKLVKRVVEQSRRIIDNKRLHFSVNLLNQDTKIFVDASSVERIVSNLLTNAVKYTNASGHVMVAVGAVSDLVYIKVKDDGIGIPKDSLEHIFERFYRVDRTGSRRYGGTGLGLSIAAELTKLNNGRLEVDSTIRKGSEFILLLPSAEVFLHGVYRAKLYNEELKSSIEKSGLSYLQSFLPPTDFEKVDRQDPQKKIDIVCGKIAAQVTASGN